MSSSPATSQPSSAVTSMLRNEQCIPHLDVTAELIYRVVARRPVRRLARRSGRALPGRSPAALRLPARWPPPARPRRRGAQSYLLPPPATLLEWKKKNDHP